MARSKKEKQAAASSSEGRSILRAAFAAYERGDSVQARSLAEQVLAGKQGPDEAAAAEALAKELVGERAVEATPAGVAAELVSRTGVPPKAYLFAGVAAFAFTVLALIARFRY
ncbi:MAG: hypothetical protein U0228_03370 [Myxococcaceae bacterium]